MEKYSQFRDRGNNHHIKNSHSNLTFSSYGHRAFSPRLDSRVGSLNSIPRLPLSLPHPTLPHLLPGIFPLLPLSPAARHFPQGRSLGPNGHSGHMVDRPSTRRCQTWHPCRSATRALSSSWLCHCRQLHEPYRCDLPCRHIRPHLYSFISRDPTGSAYQPSRRSCHGPLAHPYRPSGECQARRDQGPAGREPYPCHCCLSRVRYHQRQSHPPVKSECPSMPSRRAHIPG